ncbi:MAG: hypothetical protein JO199_07010 [Candidatus Eremiobacteraeota bacterium]|nr:hypothetical protein [Candidatus Eremiobacteraeota bacterium]
MIARFARPALAAATLVAALAAGSAPAAAQLVPRLVEYPVVHASACHAGPEAGLASRRVASGGSSPRTEVYSGSACAREALLFTVSEHTVTPTQLGASFLNRQCGDVVWTANAPADIAAAGCSAITVLVAQIGG